MEVDDCAPPNLPGADRAAPSRAEAARVIRSQVGRERPIHELDPERTARELIDAALDAAG